MDMASLVSVREFWSSRAYFLPVRYAHKSLSVHYVSESTIPAKDEKIPGSRGAIFKRFTAFTGRHVIFL